MEASLKSFVKQALLDITNAVNEAREESPVNIAPGHVEGKKQLEAQQIEFDLAVSAERATTGRKKGGVSVAVISVLKAEVGAEGTTNEKHGESNRIKFSVPVYFQAPKKPPNQR
ncbi:MAG: hypothetical protein ABSC37_05515 [Xanthobacteraceae bacterium]